nr:tripartite tricarboxylate transporter substrate binding protein [Notoacmeibacter sp. MSK16QG-6]
MFNKYTDAQMVVVNQKAGGGVVAQQTVLKGATDGGQLYFNHAADHVANLLGKTPFSYKDFRTLGTTAALSDVVLVPADAPYNTLGELVDYAKKHPKELTYVTQFGGTTEAKANAINSAADDSFKIVDGGSGADRIVLLLGGNADVSAEGVRFAKEHTGAGTLKALAVLRADRDPLVPDWPTAAEQGYDIDMPYYFTISAPEGIDDAAVSAVDEVLEKLRDDKEFAESLANLGQSPAIRTSDEAGSFVEQEYGTIEKFISK